MLWVNIFLSMKFDCEKLAQEKLEVHRQYVMVNSNLKIKSVDEI